MMVLKHDKPLWGKKNNSSMTNCVLIYISNPQNKVMCCKPCVFLIAENGWSIPPSLNKELDE